jgi:hypothetical protein
VPVAAAWVSRAGVIGEGRDLDQVVNRQTVASSAMQPSGGLVVDFGAAHASMLMSRSDAGNS